MVNGRWTQPALASFSSGGMEFEAQFSVDGNTLYFNRGSALVFSQRTPTGWSEARSIEPPADRGMCVAAAGNGTLYFTSARRPGIVRCQRVDGTYQAPEVVVSPGAHPWVAPDESFLVFDRYAFAGGRQTGSKLFVSFRRNDGSWPEPVEFGPEINATGTELIPKVSPDGKYLFFQRKVDGNTDIYWVDARVIEALRPKDLR
jgi:WD40-like Beta Propeller Repeat